MDRSHAQTKSTFGFPFGMCKLGRWQEERETKSTWSGRVAFSCLGTSALPCAYTARSRCWAGPRRGRRARKERGGEEERHSQTHSPWRPWQTGTTDSETSCSHSRHTQKNTDAHFLFGPPSVAPVVQKARANTHIRWRSALFQLSAWGLCLFGTSLSLSGSIAQWLHNVPYHFHPIHLSLTFNTASGYTSHTMPPSPLRSYVKQLVQLWKCFKYEFLRACDGGTFFFCAQDLSSRTVHQYS